MNERNYNNGIILLLLSCSEVATDHVFCVLSAVRSWAVLQLAYSELRLVNLPSNQVIINLTSG